MKKDAAVSSASPSRRTNPFRKTNVMLSTTRCIVINVFSITLFEQLYELLNVGLSGARNTLATKQYLIKVNNNSNKNVVVDDEIKRDTQREKGDETIQQLIRTFIHSFVTGNIEHSTTR